MDRNPCGLRARVEGGGWSGGFVPVPLVDVHIETKLINFTAQVTVSQSYVNREENPIECEYFFPIEEEAAVVDFRAEVEDRVLVSQVKAKEEARADYDAAVKEGKTGFLMEQTRPDILQILVGQLKPGAGAKISLTYIFEASLEIDKLRLTIPTTISPKYIPFHDNSPEAARIASIKYDFNSPAPLTFNLHTVMRTRIQEISSPSHQISNTGGKEADEQGFFTATTKLTGSTADLDRDLVVLVACPDLNRSVVFVEASESEGTRVMMLSLVPKLQIKTQPQLDVVFLIDCSGSMNGSSIQLARQAINILLHSLPASVLFNIVCFGSRYNMLFPEGSQPYSETSLGSAKAAMAGLAANLGGTEILAPLKHLLEEKSEAPRRIFVLTDGSVSNAGECIRVTRKHNKSSRVFSLGIGAGADRHLVKGLARAGLGTAEFTVEGEAMAPKVLKQLKNCLQPSLNNVHINWGFEGSSAAASSQQAPPQCPSIYSGHRVQVFRMFGPEAPAVLPGRVSVYADFGGNHAGGGDAVSSSSAENAAGSEHYFEEVDTPPAAALMKCDTSGGDGGGGTSGGLLHKMFARKLILSLEENYDDNNQEEKAEVKSLITELALRYQLMSRYTSFIAVDSKEAKAATADQIMVKRPIANQLPRGFGGGPGFARRPGSAPLAMAAAPPPPTMMMMSQANYFGGNVQMQQMAFDAAPAMSFGAAPAMSFGAPPAAPPPISSNVRRDEQERGPKKMAKAKKAVTKNSNREMSGGSDFIMASDDSEEAFEDEAAELKGEKSAMDIVMMIISLQSAQGYFNKSAQLLKAINLESEQLEAARANLDEKVFNSWFMILLLEIRYPELEDCWSLVVDKGKAWLQANSTSDGGDEDIKIKIRALLK